MFEKKLVAVMNKSIEPGILMNALAHMCIGFGAHLGVPELQRRFYQKTCVYSFENESQYFYLGRR